MSEATAKDEEAFLCSMLSLSLSNPWQFDEVINTERKNFNKAMMRFIQGQVKQLTAQAKEREAVCQPYKNKSMGYDICMGNNPARELASWLDSVLQATSGSKWEQTDFGSDQIRVWNACKNPAFCEQLRSATAVESQRVCPLMVKNNS
ncbi:hypothetical protein [Kaarinaea lacus]